MTLPRADGDLPIFRPERKLVGQFVDSRVAPKQDLRRAVRQDGGPDRRPMILALARALSDKIETDAPPLYAFGATGIPSEDQAMTVRHSASAAERLCL
jgi:hypothetical protein